MIKTRQLVAVLFSVLLLGSLLGSSAMPATARSLATVPPAAVIGGPQQQAQTSTYYAGYSVYRRTGGFARVTGTWVVPKATCNGTATLMFAWVGLDDSGVKYLEQAGTGNYCLADDWTPHYYAWYEMFPAPSIATTLVIRAGDTVRTTVSASGSKFTFKIENLTTRKTVIKKTSEPRASRLSAAYWIVEAPWVTASSAKLYPLAKFSRFTLVNASATGSGRTEPIDSSRWDRLLRWTMADKHATKATAGVLTRSGSSFKVTWYHR